MNTRHNFRQLNIWIEGVDIATETYKTTRLFPKEERYGISSQFQRAAVSIPSNIAEGSSRKSDKHFVTYLENALGSAYEWETQLIISNQIGFVSQETFNHLEKKIKNLQGKIMRFMETLEKNI